MPYAHLHAEAHPVPAGAGAGNANDLNILVSVVADSGTPASGLVLTDFVVDAVQQPPGPPANIQLNAIATPNPGVAVLALAPAPGDTWAAGVYIFRIDVTRGAHYGQTLLKVEIA